MRAKDHERQLVVHQNDKKAVSHGRAKHIDIKYYYIRDLVKRSEFYLKYGKRSVILADILTTTFPGPRHKELTTALGIYACSH